MLPVVVVMILILVLAGLVVVYVAYPHRGEDVPAAPWLGEAMARAVDAAPTIVPEEHGIDDRSRFRDSFEEAPVAAVDERRHRTS
ncbi:MULTISPECIES: hypothetical protein [unclassified Nocardioides]|uniref:hypothetical protein n=1 Tax=unclassified Nocardioides TaxID=2615069 RepID=UPI000056FB4D|nr:MULTISPECIES: hypothetical protein [unclassified Nocardioides]ABL82773.1 hypothetical protein Noca_3271 [Nocardioides sp. JS614]MBI2242646.1 hypothetical protein [Nocardioides sp.]